MSHAASSILVIGSLNMDLVSQVERLPLSGETIMSNQFYINPGGKGANQAVGIAKLGKSVSMLGKVGQDNYGDILLQTLHDYGVNTECIKQDAETGKAFITLDKDGENHIVLVPGANEKMDRETVDYYKDIVKNCSFIIMQLEIPLEVVEYVIQLAKQFNKKVILNPAPAQVLSDDILKGVHTLIPNQTELSILTRMPSTTSDEIVDAARKLKSTGVNEIIVTAGDQGAYIINEENEIHLPAQKVQVNDTTAAGDSYIAAYAVAIAEGKKSEEAALFANKAASITVTREGAQSSLPLLHEVETVKT